MRLSLTPPSTSSSTNNNTNTNRTTIISGIITILLILLIITIATKNHGIIGFQLASLAKETNYSNNNKIIDDDNTNINFITPTQQEQEQQPNDNDSIITKPPHTIVIVPSYDCSGRFSTPGSLPRFFVAGVHKGGSTSLFNYLAQHGQIRPAVCKEIHFFDEENMFARGLNFYRRHFPNINPLSSSSSNRITGEGSPSYIRHPLAPNRIKTCCPQAKIIVALRDPTARFESSWIGLHDRDMPPLGRMTCSQAWDTSRSQWDECLMKQQSNNNNNDNPTPEMTCSLQLHENFVVRSIYSYQLRRWLALGYNSTNFLAVQSEHLFTHREHTMQRVASFLNLRPYSENEMTSFTHTFEGSSHMKESVAHDCDAVKDKMNTFFRPYNEDLFTLLQNQLEGSWKDFQPELW
jgi:hypothetical protein